jgi:uncharacterized protein YndB with AHSA1/START domain
MSDRIEKRIELAAKPERVWRALASAREFGMWFGAKLEGDFAPGVTLRGPITNPGYEHLTLEMTIERMEEGRLFSFRWHPHAIESAVDYSQEATTLVELRIEPSRAGTQLVLTESGFDKLPAGRRPKAFEMSSSGWAAQLKNIARHVGSFEVRVESQIKRAPADVFAAIVDPAKMSQYFISSGSAPLAPHTRIDWEWADVGAKVTIEVTEIEPDRKIAFRWPADGPSTNVTLVLEPDGARTKLIATEGPFELTDPGVRRALGQNQGWTDFSCSLRAYLQHAINLRLGKPADDVA